MARPEKIAGFSEPFAERIVKAVERVEQMPIDKRQPRRQRPGEESSGATRTPYVIVCLGPDDETAPTNHSYWVQPLTLGDTDITDPPEVLSAGTIELIWNLGESQTETHGLHVGTVVIGWRLTDAGGNARLVCNQVP